MGEFPKCLILWVSINIEEIKQEIGLDFREASAVYLIWKKYPIGNYIYRQPLLKLTA